MPPSQFVLNVTFTSGGLFAITYFISCLISLYYSKAHLDAGRYLLVALRHDVDDIGAVGLQETHGRPGDPLGQGLVGLLVLVDHGEHDQEVVLLGHTVDVAHAGVVQQLPVGVEARLALGAIKVTLDIEILIKKELN